MTALYALLLGFILGMSAAVLLCKIADRRRDLERRELHVCPFCGSWLMIEAERMWASPPFIGTGRECWRCCCGNCGAIGPEAHSKEEALRYWGGGWP